MEVLPHVTHLGALSNPANPVSKPVILPCGLPRRA